MTTRAGVAPVAEAPDRAPGAGGERIWPYLVLGVFLGFVFTRAEVVSWFRIQEMFRFQAFHMYGIIGSAVLVGGTSTWLLKRLDARSVVGGAIEFPAERFEPPGTRYWLGGTLFGLGWGLLGACPGPIYVLIGNGLTVMIAALVGALAGVWSYAVLRTHLPHG